MHKVVATECNKNVDLLHANVEIPSTFVVYVSSRGVIIANLKCESERNEAISCRLDVHTFNLQITLVQRHF